MAASARVPGHKGCSGIPAPALLTPEPADQEGPRQDAEHTAPSVVSGASIQSVARWVLNIVEGNVRMMCSLPFLYFLPLNGTTILK